MAWNYVEPDTEVFGSDGESMGRVKQMLGTETEGIFHGLALDPPGFGSPRVVPADAVRLLTPSRVEVTLTRGDIEGLEEYHTRQVE